MGKAAELLGVSRPTLWRMLNAGRLTRVEVLPNTYRVRRREIEDLALGQTGRDANSTGQDELWGVLNAVRVVMKFSKPRDKFDHAAWVYEKLSELLPRMNEVLDKHTTN